MDDVRLMMVAILVAVPAFALFGCVQPAQKASLCICANSTNANISNYITPEYNSFVHGDSVFRTWPLNSTQSCEGETYAAFGAEFTCHDYARVK